METWPKINLKKLTALARIIQHVLPRHGHWTLKLNPDKSWIFCVINIPPSLTLFGTGGTRGILLTLFAFWKVYHFKISLKSRHKSSLFDSPPGQWLVNPYVPHCKFSGFLFTFSPLIYSWFWNKNVLKWLKLSTECCVFTKKSQVSMQVSTNSNSLAKIKNI